MPHALRGRPHLRILAHLLPRTLGSLWPSAPLPFLAPHHTPAGKRLGKILPKTSSKTDSRNERKKHALLYTQPRQIRAIHVDKVRVPDHLGRPGGGCDGGA
ncbi:hypothetical protein B0H13DRAFT_2000429, partial [Mycena leptocephala]